jgi:hypothetical protein
MSYNRWIVTTFAAKQLQEPLREKQPVVWMVGQYQE